MRRRSLLPLVGSAMLNAPSLAAGDTLPGRAAGMAALASGPIEVHGDWGASLPQSAFVVLSRMREMCLRDVRLLSDRQPERLRVDNQSSGPPFIWLHYDGAAFAWIVVDIGARDWSKLAYQFGHELGHVLCNSWGPDATPQNPCQWLEEALVEAFSIRGLGQLAHSWAERPPFPDDAAFADAIGRYRDDLMTKYRAAAAEQGANRSLAAWFREHRSLLETDGGVTGAAQGAVLAVLTELDTNPDGIEGLGALNRWPGRTGVPIDDYLRLWMRSCVEVTASQKLPIRLRNLLLR